MKYAIRFAVLVMMLMLPVLSVFHPAYAASEEELLKIIHRLEQRVDELERRLEEVEGDPHPEKSPGPAPTMGEGPDPVVNAQPPRGVDDGSVDIRTYWKDGLRFDAGDIFEAKINARVQVDFFSGEIDGEDGADADFPDGARIRRNWLSFRGTVYEDTVIRMQYEMAGGDDVDFKDMYVGYTGWDVADITVGQFREPISLEKLISNLHLTLMERSPVYQIVPDRSTGLMLSNTGALNDRLTWAAGVFLPADDFGDASEEDDIPGDAAVTARVTGVPVLADDGRRLVHLGAAYSYRDLNGDPFRVRHRGSFSRGPRLVDTGELPTADYHLFAGEAALVYGPFSLQSEYVYADVAGTRTTRDSDYQAGYLEASYFLTGEHRSYRNGVFSRVRPRRNFIAGEGWGAWQIAARLAWLDLSDSTVQDDAGELYDLVAGINWYLNPHSRVMVNYVHTEDEAEYEGAEDQTADVAQIRFQVDF